MKRCSDCGETLPLDDFCINRKMRDGRNNRCRACSRAYDKKYNEKNRDRRIAYKKKYREQNSDKVKAYADANRGRQRQYYVDNKAEIKVKRDLYMPKWNAARIAEMESNTIKRVKYLFKARRTDAKKRNIEFNLTVEMLHVLFLIQRGRCAITNIEFDMKFSDDYRSAPFSPSIDKKDARKGYTIDNVQFVCFMVNMGKSEYPQSVFDQMCLARVKVLTDAKV